MNTWLSEELQLLKESAERFVEREYPFERRRELAASEDGFGREVWAQFAEFGWLAAPLPEAHGGLGGGAREVAVLLEALGRGLVVEPYLSGVVLGGGLLGRGASNAQKAALLPAVAEGRLLLAFAHGEPRARYDLAHVETTARPDGDGWRLDGHKSVVFHAASADKILVSARTDGGPRDREGISLFMVARDALGLNLRSYPTVDGLRAAELQLEAVPAEATVGEVGAAYPLIARTVDEALVALSAEAVGIMQLMIDSTSDYLKTREQFGRALAGFQVLQHRLVEMFVACELSRALVQRAATTLDEGSAAEGARVAAAAKVQVCKAGKLIGQEAIQLHGGMGMTEEMAIGHYFKRLTMIAQTFGDHDHHLSRFAELS